MNHHLREIADCLDEALRLQSRVMDLTEQVYEAAGMSPGEGRRCGREASMGCIEVASVGSRSAKSDRTS